MPLPAESQHALVNRRGREAAADNVAAMAEGLSSAMQRALLDAQDSADGLFLSTYRLPERAFSRLHDLGLVFIVVRGAMLTPLGLAVREHLAAKS